MALFAAHLEEDSYGADPSGSDAVFVPPASPDVGRYGCCLKEVKQLIP